MLVIDMSEEEKLAFLLMLFYLLEQRRQASIRRIMSYGLALINFRNLEIQQTALDYFANIYPERRAWVFHRSSEDFDTYYEPDLNTSKELDPNYWLFNYRMSRKTFDFVCDTVFMYMVKEHTHLRETIPVPKRVGVAIWWLANGGSYRSTGQVFGISAEIVGRIIHDFVGSLVHLRNKFIIWPIMDNCSETVKTFQKLSLLPNIFGAVDGTHVQIMAPSNSTLDFFDRKQRYSIGCQAVCDGNLRFLSVSAGYPGSVHDSRILRNSWLFQEANNESILAAPIFHLNENIGLKPYLVGDAAYPLFSWLIKPFQQTKHLAYSQQQFNVELSRARVCIERAFGVLKGRWRVLLGKVCLEPSFVADIFVACAVLHNICQERREPVDDLQPQDEPDLEQQNNEICGRGDEIRNLLLEYIVAKG